MARWSELVCVLGLVFAGGGVPVLTPATLPTLRLRASLLSPGKDVYVNTASLSNGTSFVESLFEEFGMCGRPGSCRVGAVLILESMLTAGVLRAPWGRRIEAVSLCPAWASLPWVLAPAPS